MAEQRGAKPAQVALAWLLAQPAVTAPIIGATKLAHLEDAVEATEIELYSYDVEVEDPDLAND